MVHVIDDFFTDKFLLEAYEECMDIPWQYKNVANRRQYPYNDVFCKGSHRLFGSELYTKKGFYFSENKTPHKIMEALEIIIQYGIPETEPNLSLVHVDANLQIYGQDGTTHYDEYVGGGKDRTILFYPHHKWEKEWGGALQILDDNENVIEEHLPIPGRAIYFDSSVPHRGLGPNVKDTARISIAYRMSI